MQAKVFGLELTAGQLNIVGSVLDPKIKRLSVCAMTRYGKTRSVDIGLLLIILDCIPLWGKPVKILLIAPTISQTNIIRNYMAEHIATVPALTALVDTRRRGTPESLRKEVSRKRVTFNNGCEIITLTAHGKGEEPGKQLMGFGGDIIVIDEACLVSDEVYRSRISRMLGDNPNSKLIELVNPWHKRNFAWRHWQTWNGKPGCKCIHIDYLQALREGRVTEAFIQEQQEELSEYQFTVLYKSEFPDDAEDTLIRWSWINDAIEKTFVLEKPRTVWGLDVGEQGPDLTVLTKTQIEGVTYKTLSQQIIRENETMPIANAVDEIVPKGEVINVDSIGVGAGVYSRLREKGHNAVSIRVSEKATSNPERYLNLKAQRYWQLRTILENGFWDIPKIPQLSRQLSLMKYEYTAAGKIKIVSPANKSPDFADSLCLCVVRTMRPPRARTSRR